MDLMNKPESSFSLRTLITGFLMGAADLVPGISGGTVALLGGVYGRLLAAISAVNGQALKLVLSGQWRAAWRHVDGGFLGTLFIGMALAFLGVAKAIHYLLDYHPIMMWSLFLGLIFTAGVMLLKELQRHKSLAVAFLFGGFLVSALLAQMPVQSAWDTVSGWQYLGLLLAGSVAVSAMILPGISGSFILLLVGVYPFMIASLATLNIPVLGVFLVGCVVGLLSFSRLISWLLKNYTGATMSTLTGLMLGSALKLWPWKYTLTYRLNSAGEQVPLLQENLWPWNYTALTGIDHELPIALVSILVALVLVARFGQIKLQDLGH